MSSTNISWLLKMAWRDSRRNRSRLLLFVSSVIIGIAALVAINSFSENLQKDIESEAKTLLGADIRLENNEPAADSIVTLMETWGGDQSTVYSFGSMVLFPKSGGTRLVDVRAIEGGYPFYGNVVTEPANQFHEVQSGKYALLEKTLMLQFDVKPGDKVKIGAVVFEVLAQMNSAPGRAGIAGSIAPVVYIPMEYLPATNLVTLGSRVNYFHYFKFPDDIDTEEIILADGDMLEASGWEVENVEGRKKSLGQAFGQLTAFLNLVGFIALLLGCIGVASAVHIYVKDKISTIAILRTLGVSGRQAFLIYLIQVTILGLIGGIIGALLGSAFQVALPLVLQDFLPVQNVSNDISIGAIGLGVLTGLGITILFGLLPLLSVRKISPLRALRASYENDTAGRDPVRWLVYGLIGIFIIGFTFIQTGTWQSIVFPIGVGLSFLLLAGVAKILMWLVKRFFPTKWSYIWRQSIANLYRPNNQTLILIVTVGLGTMLISTLFFTQDLILQQVSFAGSGDQPNMILFDIQSTQKDGVTKLVNDNDLPLIQEVPIVTMRMDNVNGITKTAHLADEDSEMSDWVFEREYRVSYRDTLTETETIVEGEWKGEVGEDGIIYISIATNIQDNMNVGIGDKVTFNVQGTLIETTIGSVREIEFGKIQTNFFVLFPKGVLEAAPKFHVIVSRVNSDEQSAEFQQALVEGYPNVSAIDLTQILKSVESVLSKVSFVIRFMAFFSILTGLLVLISSVVLSKYQRIKESVLLRTLGASRRQILTINALEYFLLGALATITGIGLSLLASYLLATFQFKIPFTPGFWPSAGLFAVITGLTVIIGLVNSREVVQKPPLEVLRKEV